MERSGTGANRILVVEDEPAISDVCRRVLTSEGFDKAQRAYVLTCKKSGKPSKVKFQLTASLDNPVINPAFVVKNWGTAEAELNVNGKKVFLGKDFRAGYERTLRAGNLIIWLRAESVKPMSISLSPAGG